MKKVCFFLMLFAATFTNTYGQENDFHAYAKKEKIHMLKAYAQKDVAGFQKYLNEFVAKYATLNDKDRERYKFELQEEYYLMACTYAVKGDKKIAIDYLFKSENYDYDELTQDRDLDHLRKEPRFLKFLADSKKPRSEYTTTLQKAEAYNADEKYEVPAFTYQSANDPNLAALKIAFNLDSVAGNGDDVSKIINLMEWVHYLVPHDGSKGNPQVKNAMSMIKECKKDGKTLNCRGLAILLNEVYLAEGFKSRFVTCLPKDINDNDCHVINVVWSPSLKKWLWMDPTFMAYVMNEDGGLLSIEEVRARLIAGKPLILNPDANRNHAVRQTISDYLGYYMSKNLYKLECPISSEYNYETKGDNKATAYVALLPGKTHPAPESQKDKHGVATYQLYFTNSPAAFWAAPPANEIPVKPEDIARSVTDYEQVMAQYKTCYNRENTSGLTNLVSDDWGEHKKTIFRSDRITDDMKGYGRLIEFKYLAQDDGDNNHDVALFKVTYDKSVHVMGISLDKNNKMLTIRGETSSTYIDKLLAREL